MALTGQNNDRPSLDAAPLPLQQFRKSQQEDGIDGRKENFRMNVHTAGFFSAGPGVMSVKRTSSPSRMLRGGFR